MATPPMSTSDPKQIFRFFDLPSELRRKIFTYLLVQERTVDLSPENQHKGIDRLSTFLTCHRFHEEAYPIFYGGNTFRVFPIHPNFYGSKARSILTRLSPRYRAAVVSVELRLGPGWSKPPRTWAATDRLRLAECTSVRNLIVFVECDPSHQIFKGFRASKDFFTDFSGNLLGGLIERLPSLEHVSFDRYPAVRKDGELMTRLRNVVEEKRKRIVWVPGKWDDPVSLQGRVHKTLRSDLLCAIEAIMGHEQA